MCIERPWFALLSFVLKGDAIPKSLGGLQLYIAQTDKSFHFSHATWAFQLANCIGNYFQLVQLCYRPKTVDLQLAKLALLKGYRDTWHMYGRQYNTTLRS